MQFIYITGQETYKKLVRNSVSITKVNQYGEIIGISGESHSQHKNIPCRKSAESLMLKQGQYILTTVLEMVTSSTAIHRVLI
jgi:hypothetical protein